jgi:peptidoglycan/LPS O-acetylase OafA/YrhL
MLDLYRFVLALCVLQDHLLVPKMPGLAWQAVFTFYVLSGFLMALVLNEVYGFGPQGFARFLANRALRLYPAYWAVVLVTVIFILCVSPANQLNGALSLPQTAAGWASNLSLVGLVGVDKTHVAQHRLVPTAWSLTIELFCYVLLAAYFARSIYRLAALLGAGVAIAAVHFAAQIADPAPDYGFFNHYIVLQAGLIPFAAGGLAYFALQSPWCRPSGARIAILVLLLVLNGCYASFSDFHRYVSGLYVAVLLNFLLVPMLFRFDEAYGKRSWQITLGGMAYPLFIAHWFVGTVVFLMWGSLAPKGIAHFLLTLIACLAAAFGLYAGIDRNIDKMRLRLKQRASPRLEAAWPVGSPVASDMPRIRA